MLLRIVAHDVHFNEPANCWVYPSKITHDKTSAVRNVHIIRSNFSPPAITQAQRLLLLSNDFVDDTLIQIIPQCILVARGHPSYSVPQVLYFSKWKHCSR